MRTRPPTVPFYDKQRLSRSKHKLETQKLGPDGLITFLDKKDRQIHSQHKIMARLEEFCTELYESEQSTTFLGKHDRELRDQYKTIRRIVEFYTERKYHNAHW